MSNELRQLKSDSPAHPIGLSHLRRWGIVLLLVAAFLVICLPGITSTPTPWWDEGWTMLVARNWVEQGHYGRFLAGVPYAPGLSASLPTVASLALSFKLLGVGIGQARLPILLYTVATLGLLYFLALRLYDRAAAVGTLVVALLLSPQRLLQPIFIGRQVWAEMPLMFFLLAGYVCFLLALRRHRAWMPLAIILWAVALMTKVQVLPFWLISISTVTLVALLLKRWTLFFQSGIMLAGSLLGYYLLLQLQPLVLPGLGAHGDTMQGLYDVTALVLDSNVRSYSLSMLVIVGLPLVLGLAYALWQQFRQRASFESTSALAVTRLALWVLAGGWTVWYVVLSNGWLRYLFPATFVGSIFVSVMLRAATRGFNLRLSMRDLGRALRARRFTRSDVKFLLAIMLVAMMLPFNAVALYLSFAPGDGISVVQAADYLNRQTSDTALIESYESELLFLLNRHYHFPPDQYHVDKMRHTLLNDNQPIEYDPLAVQPDYIVLGTYARMWDIYDAALATGQYRQVYANSEYQIYAQQR